MCRTTGVTHFVDDRLDVLASLTTVSHRFLFVGGLGTGRSSPLGVPAGITLGLNWKQMAAAIRVSIPR